MKTPISQRTKESNAKKYNDYFTANQQNYNKIEVVEYTVLSYYSKLNVHTIRDKNDNCFSVDLCVDASWDKYLELGELCTCDDVESLCKSMIGKKIEIEELRPLTYYAKNTKSK